MARAELTEHRKFLRLVHILGMPEPHVLGHLEYLWRSGYQTGNAYVGDSKDVELAAKWHGEEGQFFTALTAKEVNLLDMNQDGTYSIHDLYDHAPEYAKKRMRRKGFGQKPKTARRRKTADTGDKETPPAATSGLPIPEKLNTPEFITAWTEWKRYRKEDKNKPLPERSEKAQLKALSAFSVIEAITLVNRSMDKDWLDVVYDKDQPGNVHGDGKARTGRMGPANRSSGKPGQFSHLDPRPESGATEPGAKSNGEASGAT